MKGDTTDAWAGGIVIPGAFWITLSWISALILVRRRFNCGIGGEGIHGLLFGVRDVSEMEGTRNFYELGIDSVVLEQLEHLGAVFDGVGDICPTVEKLHGAGDLTDGC